MGREDFSNTFTSTRARPTLCTGGGRRAPACTGGGDGAAGSLLNSVRVRLSRPDLGKREKLGYNLINFIENLRY